MSKANFRSSDSSRVGKGVANFPVSACADAGHLTVEVTGPASAKLTPDADFSKPQGSKKVTWKTDIDPSGTEFVAQVALNLDVPGAERTVTINGKPVTVKAYPGDTKWLDVMSENAPAAVAALQRLTGTDLPVEVTTIKDGDQPMLSGRTRFARSRASRASSFEAVRSRPQRPSRRWPPGISIIRRSRAPRQCRGRACPPTRRFAGASRWNSPPVHRPAGPPQGQPERWADQLATTSKDASSGQVESPPTATS